MPDTVLGARDTAANKADPPAVAFSLSSQMVNERCVYMLHQVGASATEGS